MDDMSCLQQPECSMVSFRIYVEYFFLNFVFVIDVIFMRFLKKKLCMFVLFSVLIYPLFVFHACANAAIATCETYARLHTKEKNTHEMLFCRFFSSIFHLVLFFAFASANSSNAKPCNETKKQQQQQRAAEKKRVHNVHLKLFK